MNLTIKKMETEEEIRGKAFVHWASWHAAYPGMVSEEYLERLTPEACERMARRWTEGILVAKDGDRVIGFVGYGSREENSPETGEIFALYVLPEYYGTGAGLRLMEAGLGQLKEYPEVCLWVLKENERAIRFYRKCGFSPSGEEMVSPIIAAREIRMILKR